MSKSDGIGAEVAVRLLVALCLIASHGDNPVGMVVPRPGIGGGIQGDPAPGRSPGPPIVVGDFSQNDIPEEQPTEMLTTDDEETFCVLHAGEAPEVVDVDRDTLNFSISHKLFKSDILIPGIVYQVTFITEDVSSSIEISLTSVVNGINKGKFTGQNTIHRYPCSSYTLRETLQHQLVHIYNWTIDSTEEFTSNVTFQLQYRRSGSSTVFHRNYFRTLHQDCQLRLSPEEGVISWLDFPPIVDCQIWFPGHESGHGLVVELYKLNVPCSRGYLHFSGLNTSQHHGFYGGTRGGTNHKPSHLCGKLEELPDADRHIYFPSASSAPFLHIHGNPVFVLGYHWVDYCYNVTLTDRNGSFDLQPRGSLQCSFKISIPYGNRVAVILQLGDATMPMVGPEDAPPLRTAVKESECAGLYTELFDGDSSWWHCTLPGDKQRRIEIVSRENKVLLRVSVKSALGVSGVRSAIVGGGNSDSGASESESAGGGVLSMRMEYRADPIEEIVGRCGFGWVAMRQFCIGAVEGARLPWAQAEMECGRRGGHLVSIRSEHAQVVVDNLLLNSPGYREHNAYWIGASDKTHEGDFRWSDGLPFSYSHWFPGWSDHGFYNRQPNDDGLSEQDCLEVRRVYQMPTSSSRLADSFMWNDRDCATPNYFICERLQSDEPLEDGWPTECNKTVILSRQQSKASVSSPGFPRQYPDNVFCITEVMAPTGYRIVLDFEELVLEEEPSCSYDFLDIIELPTNGSNGGANGSNGSSRRLCGDWSSKLKLLRYVSSGSRITLRFSSDYSHHFGGFKARVSMENAMQCSDDRLQMFNHSCYLFVSYPEVTWNTALQICHGMKAHLASVVSPEEEQFITTNIRRTAEYRTSALYWLGAQMTDYNKFLWIDQTPMSYSAFLPGQNPEENSILGSQSTQDDPYCLGMQWMTPPTPMLPSGLYWKSQKCTGVGGYVCKRRNQISGSGINFNRTLNGSEGYLTTPNHPGIYYHNLDFLVRIVSPERTRIVIQFTKLDIEYQMDCLYDFVQLQSVPRGIKPSPRYCGTETDLMSRFDFVSAGNEVEIVFHSDYSISGSGFAIKWYAVDVSACPVQTLTSREGILTSPNYPHVLLSDLDCTYNILAPSGKRIWVEFTNYDFADGEETSEMADNRDAFLEIDLGARGPRFRPFQISGQLTDGAFLSDAERLQIRLKTTGRPRGMGFRATYKTVSQFHEERNILLENGTAGNLLHLNYPNGAPSNIDFLQHFVAPANHIISLELYHVKVVEEGKCPFARGTIEVFDNYADSNGTQWHLCDDRDTEDFLMPNVPIAVTSYLNTLHLRQKNGLLGIPLNGSLRVHYDENYKEKLFRLKDNEVESCSPNPCLHEGRCISNGVRKFCKCSGHFTGLFCALNMCELEPCVYGTCQLTASGYKCHCRKGYTGSTCEQKTKPCEGNPCESRGVCQEQSNGGFQCKCHAWWEGARCERRMMNIPYKPLSERMLHEPFWLGLITVFVVMGVIGLFWCAKRHFPEKLEKLLAEEADRNNRSTTSTLRSSSVREQLAASGAASVAVTPSPGPNAPRSLFGRLGIRKPSILSLTSPHGMNLNAATAARTFSLDDLLKPPPIRTPSPRKKRNNSTPTKKNAAEKKQILQQLIAPSSNKSNPKKVTLGELMQLSEKKLKVNDASKSEAAASNEKDVKETPFITNNAVATTSAQLSDPKLEKKVTFARLLNKVSAEMSSGSEIEMGTMKSSLAAASLQGAAIARPASTPPSPAADSRSPNSTSSIQGSDSLSSSDLGLPTALSSSASDLMISKRPGKFPSNRQKPSSADSILAMFRNFSSSSAGANLPSSIKLSPSTTPTASSPQDDIAGDDESSTSSVHTPVSFSSGYTESPVHHKYVNSTIEVPVLDPLSAHKGSNSGSNLLHPPTILLEIPSSINKCLSPIREMPTPLPSPMPTPIPSPMHRSTASSSAEDLGMENSDDRMSVELPCATNSYSEGEDDSEMHTAQDIVIDLQAEDGLIQEEAAAMQKQTSSSVFRTKMRPPPLGRAAEPNTFVTIPTIEAPPTSSQEPVQPRRSPLIIPTLTIQTPSPTHQRHFPLPGSPPPQRARPQHDSNFTLMAPCKPNAKRMLKEFDKPTSLDLPCAPPLITITFNMSEVESDAESISPAAKNTGGHLGPSSGGMCYLSPFSMCSRSDRTASESNLSSSGYSSMASPGPSRCGSNNPLCPSEMEDPGPSGPGPANYPMGRRPSPLLRSTTSNEGTSSSNTDQREHGRGRSDSETLSDDPLLESNDEGIGTDHIDEKIEEGELKSAKELQVFIGKELFDCGGKTLLDTPLLPTCVISPKSSKCGSSETVDRLPLPPVVICKSSLQLPSIVVQSDSSGCEKHLSPVSSRSESPLSDRTTGLNRFSPQFYGRHKDLLPFTDSDGLYDFPSSDCPPPQNNKISVGLPVQQHRKSVGRRREKKSARCKTPSPTKPQQPTGQLVPQNHLDIPGHHRTPSPRKPSPKRRARTQLISSSSSSESITSAREMRLSSSSPSPDTVRWTSPLDWPIDIKSHKSPEASGEETGEDITSAMLPKGIEEISKPVKRISRLRTISHQIRFLRRLEISLKRRERTVSPSDSVDSDNGEDSPRATSPLLQPYKETKKATMTSAQTRAKRNKFRRGEMLLGDDDRTWKQVAATGNGHSD